MLVIILDGIDVLCVVCEIVSDGAIFDAVSKELSTCVVVLNGVAVLCMSSSDVMLDVASDGVFVAVSKGFMFDVVLDGDAVIGVV